MLGLFKKDTDHGNGCTAHHFGEKRYKDKLTVKRPVLMYRVVRDYYQVCQHEGCPETRHDSETVLCLPSDVKTDDILEALEDLKNSVEQEDDEVDDVYQDDAESDE